MIVWHPIISVLTPTTLATSWLHRSFYPLPPARFSFSWCPSRHSSPFLSRWYHLRSAPLLSSLASRSSRIISSGTYSGPLPLRAGPHYPDHDSKWDSAGQGRNGHGYIIRDRNNARFSFFFTWGPPDRRGRGACSFSEETMYAAVFVFWNLHILKLRWRKQLKGIYLQ